MPPEYTPKFLARFWAKVNRNGPVPSHRPELGPCWLWTGSINHGYGRISLGPQGAVYEFRAHRVSWELHYGPIPDGLFVCHHCDTSACVRPSHLFVGDQAANAADMVAKGRSLTGDRNVSRQYPERVSRGAAKSVIMLKTAARGAAHGLRKHPERVARGERQGGSKLTAPEVIEMRQRYAAGGVTHKQLAVDFGISSSHACGVIGGSFWRHLPIYPRSSG